MTASVDAANTPPSLYPSFALARVTDPAPTPEALDPQGRPLRSRSPIGRRVVTSLNVALTGFVIWYGAGAIQRDTFGRRPDPSIDRDCAAGIHRLHGDFDQALGHWREGRQPPNLDALDGQLRALKPVCDREGASGAEAYEHLARWRYRAETQARLWSEALNDDARGALSYQHHEGSER